MARPPPIPGALGAATSEPTPLPTISGRATRTYRAIAKLARWSVGNVFSGEVLPQQTPCSIVFPDLVATEVEPFLNAMRDEIERNRLLVGLPVVGFVYAGQTLDRRAFVVLPDPAQPDLESHIRENGPLAPIAALQLSVVLADALTRLHYRSRCLGELRPWTVILPTDRTERLRVLDLGITRGLFRDSIRPPTPSRRFASPMVRAGQTPKPRDDLYALGALLYFALTGEPPPAQGDALASRRRDLRPFGSFIDGLIVQTLSAEPEKGALPLPDMMSLSRALRGLRDLHRLSPSAQRAVLLLRAEGRGVRPPPPPGFEPLPAEALGFVETDGPSFLTQAEIESIETHSLQELEDGAD